VAEANEALAAPTEGSEALTGLAELTNEITPAIPGLYPSSGTFPSAAATWPAEGTPEIPGLGLALGAPAEQSLALTPIGEV
jgi:hypothetical protein